MPGRRRREAAGAALQGAWERLQLLAAGVAPAAAGDRAAAVLGRHLVRGEGEAAVDALLRYQQARPYSLTLNLPRPCWRVCLVRGEGKAALGALLRYQQARLWTPNPSPDQPRVCANVP